MPAPLRARKRASPPVTINLPIDEWREIFTSERLTGALLDRPAHHASIGRAGLRRHGDHGAVWRSRIEGVC